MISNARIERGFKFLLVSRIARSGALSFSAISYPLYMSILGFTNVQVGFLTFFVVIFTVVQTLLLGILGDRKGYKFAVIVGEIFPLISTAALFFITSGPLLYLSVIGGLAGGPGGMRGSFSPGSTALVARNWPDGADRVKKLGLITSFGSLFSVVGGIMVIFRSDLITPFGSAGSYRLLFGISFALVLISFIALFLVTEREAPAKKKGYVNKGSVKHIGKTVFANAMNGAGIGFSMPIMSLWMEESFFHTQTGTAQSSTIIGLIFTVSYVTTALGSYMSSRYKRRGEMAAKIGSYGRIAQGALLIPFAFSPYIWMAGLIYVVRAGVAGFGLPSRSNINVSGLQEGDYGAGTSLQGSAARIAQTTTGASGVMMDIYLPLPEVVGGLIQAAAGVVYYRMFVTRKKDSEK